jgi:acyl carrier protein
MDNIDIDVAKDVKKFIESRFLFNSFECTIDEDTSFMESGIVDSTGILELIAFLQEQYHITIEDNEMLPQNLDSLSSISKYIKSKLCAL